MMRQFIISPYNWIILIVGLGLLLYAYFRLTRSGGDDTPGEDKGRKQTSLDDLNERYARSEISREEFERLKQELEAVGK
jgi:uncharacterized membrane protein